MKVKVTITIEDTIDVSGRGSMQENYDEAEIEVSKRLKGGGYSAKDTDFEFEPVMDIAPSELPLEITSAQDGDMLEFYMGGYYFMSAKFDDLSDEVKEVLGLIHDEDSVTNTVVKPTDQTLHVYNHGQTRVWIDCEVSEVFPDDPGQGSPLTVYLTRNIDGELWSGSLAMALDQGVLHRDDLEYELHSLIMKKLESHSKKAFDWLEETVNYIKTHGRP